jgi:Zn-dependent peptidase ImmA (M78 family)/transcriptional regulator with XRE-family HTH domain
MPSSRFKADVTPEVLKWARESLDLTVEEVAARLRRSPDGIRQWESGKDAPSVRVLERLASLYRRPLAVFYLPSPPEDAPAPEDFRRLPGGKEPRLSLKARLALRKAQWLQGVASGLVQGLNPLEPRARRVLLEQNAAVVARQERKSLGITAAEQLGWKDASVAFRSWRGALERQGILVLQLSFPVEDARGFSLSDTEVPTVVVNGSDVLPARIFTLCHEYGHLLLKSSGVCLPDPSDEAGLPRQLAAVERFCNDFAGELLVPKTDLLEATQANDRSWDAKQIGSMAKHWKVSRQVIWRRLYAAQLISRAQYWARANTWKRSPVAETPAGKFFAAPPPLRVLREKGRFFTNLVLTAHRRDLITTSDVADFLGVKVRHLPKIEELLQANGGP